jgi:hypothetical protein
MQDAAMFFRHQAVACFHRRRRWPFLSAAWRHEVDDARRFIRACRDSWQHDQPHQILRTFYALGPKVREQRDAMRQLVESAWLARMTPSEAMPYVVCMTCGWLHVGLPPDQPAGDACFHCGGIDLAAIAESEARVKVPPGVTIQAVHWPPPEKRC